MDYLRGDDLGKDFMEFLSFTEYFSIKFLL